MSTFTADPIPARAMHAPMSFSIKLDSSTGQQYMAVSQKGRALLLNPFTNKGTAFSRREREELDLGGLVPPAVCSIRQQCQTVGIEAYSQLQEKPAPGYQES